MSVDDLNDVAQIDALLNQARMVLAIQKARGNTITITRARREMDKLLDRRLELTGPPICNAPGCGRVKSRFGSQVHLCPKDDFLVCENAHCDRRVLALDALTCNPCRGVPYSPWPPL